MNVLIIEPHGDDALCSCSSVLRSDKFSSHIITLSERSSYDLIENDEIRSLYPGLVSVDFRDLKDLSFYDRPKVNTYDIHRRFNSGEDVYVYYCDKVCEVFEDRFSTTVSEIFDVLYAEIRKNEYDLVLCPVGLNHPYHIATRLGLESALVTLNDECFTNIPILLYYVDKPYLQNRYVREMYESFKRANLCEDEIISPYVDKEDSVTKTLKEVYPTEVGMLRFSKDILTKSQDIFCYQKGSKYLWILKLFEESLR